MKTAGSESARRVPRAVMLCSVYVFAPVVVVAVVLGSTALRGDGDDQAWNALFLCLLAAPFSMLAVIVQALALVVRNATVTRWVSEFFWMVFFLALLRLVLFGGYLITQIPPALQNSLASRDMLPVLAGLAFFSLFPTVLNALTARVMDRWSLQLAGEAA